MGAARDPFSTLGVPYDAGPDAVRRAFRTRALRTHPDRGGTAEAFHEVQAAYAALSRDLEGERARWRPGPAPAPAPAGPPPSRFAAGLDPETFPTCPVRLSRSAGGERRVAYATDARPAGWRPGPTPPPGGTCRERVGATGGAPAFGVWTVPLGAARFRCVFGPHPGL